MIQILLLMIISALLLSDDSFDSFISSMKQKVNHYKSEGENIEKYNKLYGIPSKEETLKKNEKLLNTLEIIGKNAKEDIFSREKKSQSILKKDKKVDTIFYLFSTSQSEYMFYNFIQESSQLEKINSDIKYYGVVQGILSKEDLQNLYIPFESMPKMEEKAVIKMQAFIFKDLDLQRVPVYLFSKCPKSPFHYKKCENKYLVRGEISLAKALDVVSKEDKYYLKYLNALEGREK